MPARLGRIWGDGETADRVAHLMERAGEDYLSGERIRRRLGISRTAVWKAVRQLRREGYEIEARRTSGYRLKRTPDTLLPRTVREGLKVSILAARHASFRRVTSTNDVGQALAERGCPDGTLVTAETQSRGRGRLGRHWHSPPGAGLWFSVVLRPKLPVSGSQALAFLGAVAAAQAIRSVHGLPVTLKWPNDLQCRGRKLGGVLVEMSAESDLIRHAVLGVGINLNVTRAGFPPALRDTATSVRLLLRKPVPRVPLFRRILEEMDRRYARLTENGSAADLVREGRELTPMIGRIVRLRHLNRVHEGTVVGLDADGALLLRSGAGAVSRWLAGDVTILRE